MIAVKPSTEWGFPVLRETLRQLHDAEAMPVGEVIWRTATVQACVTLTDRQRMAVVLSCPPELAARFASRMFDCAPEDVSDADCADAMGEIANMIGGRVKADFAPEAVIGLPAVCFQDYGSMQILGARLCSSINVALGEDRMSVAVYEESRK